MNIIETIKRDLKNNKLEGFFFESDGNSICARRINPYQFDVTTESWRGIENSYYKVSPEKVLDWVEELYEIDDHCTYIPHFPATHWSQPQIDKFINQTCIRLCDPYCKGFALTEDGENDFVVRRHCNRIEWVVDGKPADFSDVIRKTKAALAKEAMWKYVEI